MCSRGVRLGGFLSRGGGVRSVLLSGRALLGHRMVFPSGQLHCGIESLFSLKKCQTDVRQPHTNQRQVLASDFLRFASH